MSFIVNISINRHLLTIKMSKSKNKAEPVSSNSSQSNSSSSSSDGGARTRTKSGRPKRDRGTIAGLKRKVPKPKRSGAKTEPTKRVEPVNTILLLETYYNKLTEEQINFISGLRCLKIDKPTYLTDLQEVVEAVQQGGKATRVALAQAKNIESIMWSLPQMIKIDSIHTINAESEFDKIGGTILTTQCRSCGGYEYICRGGGGAGDEITRIHQTCVTCGAQ
jgi:hypothetical protein